MYVSVYVAVVIIYCSVTEKNRLNMMIVFDKGRPQEVDEKSKSEPMPFICETRTRFITIFQCPKLTQFHNVCSS